MVIERRVRTERAVDACTRSSSGVGRVSWARTLLPVPVSWLDGDTAIDRGYPKPYSPEQMRDWMRQVKLIHEYMAEDRTLPFEDRRLTRCQAAPTSPDERVLGETYRALFRDDGSTAIRASLNEAGRLEVDAGRHRVHYAREEGVEVLPVWVSTPTEADARRVAVQCRDAVERTDPNLEASYRTPGERTPTQERPTRGRDR